MNEHIQREQYYNKPNKVRTLQVEVEVSFLIDAFEGQETYNTEDLQKLVEKIKKAEASASAKAERVRADAVRRAVLEARREAQAKVDAAQSEMKKAKAKADAEQARCPLGKEL